MPRKTTRASPAPYSDLPLPAHPNVEVQLTGENGNVFNVIGQTAKALRRAGLVAESEAYVKAAYASASYDAVLQLTMRTVTVN